MQVGGGLLVGIVTITLGLLVTVAWLALAMWAGMAFF